MSLTSTAAKWGMGPTLAATLIGGTALGATVSVFQYEAIGHTLGILSKTAPMVGPAMQEGANAVTGATTGQPRGGAPETTTPGADPNGVG